VTSQGCDIWKKHTARLIVVFTLLLVLFDSGCKTVSPKLQDEFIRLDLSQGMCRVFDENRQSIQKFMMDEKIPGASIALVDRDGILWAAGFGYTDKKRKTPVTTETIFGVMSVTKVITATAVMFAIQDGLVELDTPIVEYLPDFSVHSRFEENPQEKITLRHLLTHTSGLTHDTMVGNIFEAENVSFEEHIKSISNTWLRHRVGERQLYSNIDMDLVAYILQIRTGKPYSEFLTETVFKPLNMSNTSTDLSFIRRHPNRAIGHFPFVKETSLDPINYYLGAASVFTNAKDLARFIRFHLNRGRVDQIPVLDERFIDIMYTPAPLLYPKKGQERSKLAVLGSMYINGSRQIGHEGGAFGYRAYMYWYPEYGFGALIMVNSSSLTKETGAYVRINNIMNRIISEKYVERNKLFDAIPWTQVWKSSTASSVGHDPNTFTPYKPAWKKYEGAYRYRLKTYKLHAHTKILMALFGGVPLIEMEVRQKDGYLEIVYEILERKCDRLDEYQPGLFFTKDGRCLDFRGKIPTWQNYRIEKIR
jgi:CubicO group peptidase (beta-lactamase class C family)